MSALERALAVFEAELRGPRRARRRLLDEVAAHLEDALDAALATGARRHEAEHTVLERFGDPRAAATVWNCERGARRRAERRNALVLALAVAAAAALGVTQHASGKNTPAPKPQAHPSARLHHQ